MKITGHSLGGSISQYLGAKYGVETETFNAYGIGNILAELGISVADPSKITNHILHYDPVSMLPGSKMVGTTLDYKTPADAVLDTGVGAFLSLYGIGETVVDRILDSHGIGNFQDGTLAAQAGQKIDIDVLNPIVELNSWIQHTFGSRGYSGSLMDLELGISPLTATTFTLATQALPARRDPLTLDLDGNGLDTTGIDPTAPILFDHDGDGIKTATGWVKASDAFLVLDRNGNNTIDTGRELFGDSTPLYAGADGQTLAADGFAALAQEDSNADGRVDASDTRFADLRLWQDANQDGISQSGELFTLEQKGIAALIVAKTENAVLLGNGNQIADLGGFIRSDGSGGTLGAAEQLADVDLASNPFFSEFADHVPLTGRSANLCPT
jgi:hypothetical protein